MSGLPKTLPLNPLTAISPLDGRYWSKLSDCALYFSEYSLIKYRIKVEIEYYIALVDIPLPQLKDFDTIRFREMRKWYAILQYSLYSGISTCFLSKSDLIRFVIVCLILPIIKV